MRHLVLHSVSLLSMLAVAMGASDARADIIPTRFEADRFITESRLDAWHAAHPDWPLAENADGMLAPRFAARAIRVPDVEIGGWKIGPVWFTERPDRALREFMSRMTDAPVEGVLGGNAFTNWRTTLDYPNATAYFVCLRGCAAIPPQAPELPDAARNR